MRLLTLWQPWASLVALGIKHFETRSWRTDYRGSVAIHAAKQRPRWSDASPELWQAAGAALAIEPELLPPAEPAAFRLFARATRDLVPWNLPHGAVLGVATLGGCSRVQDHLVADGVPPLEDDAPWGSDQRLRIVLLDTKGMIQRTVPLNPTEAVFGNFGIGRFVWSFEDAIAIEPVVAPGRQGFAQIDRHLGERLRVALIRERNRRDTLRSSMTSQLAELRAELRAEDVETFHDQHGGGL